MLVLKNAFTLENAEASLAWLDQNPKDNELAFPTNIRQRELAGEAAFVQFVLTWAQRHKTKAHISAYVSPQDLAAARGFVENLPGLVAALAADAALDHNTKRNVRPELLAAAFERLSFLSGPRPWTASKGTGVDLLCVDHFGLGSPPIFYENEQVRGELWFRDIAMRLLTRATPGPYRANLSARFAQEIGSVIFELFQNTDVHARTSISGDFIRPSVRGLTIRHRSVSREVLLKRAGDDHAFQLYAQNLPEPLEGFQNDKYIELSIFDSGPGFASRWTSKPVELLSAAEELNGLQACFARGATTRKGSRYGQGLPYVIEKIKVLRGLIRIRSGRLSVFADLMSDEITETGSPPFRDTSGGPIVLRSPVAGATLSMFIPVGQV